MHTTPTAVTLRYAGHTPGHFDAVEAMSLHRPHRDELGIEMALSGIQRGRGSVYDSAVADACIKCFREKHYRSPE